MREENVTPIQGAARRTACVASLACAAFTGLTAQSVPRWTVNATPTLTLGHDDTDPAALLQVIVSAMRLDDGSILVGDRGEFAFKLFSPSGAFQRAFARQGSGPGEVRYLIRPLRCGDALYATDVEEGHLVSVFTLEGRFMRSFRYRMPPQQQAPYSSACNAAGQFVHFGWDTRTERRGGIHRAAVPVWTTTADTTAPRMLDSIPGSERWGFVEGGRVVGSRPLPLGKQPVLGIGRTRIYVGSADRFEIRAYDLSGRPAQALRRPGQPESVEKADIESEIERAVAETGGTRRAAVEASYAALTFPPTLPAYTALVVDAEDRVWVRAFARGSASAARWYVFDATGALLAEVELPKALSVYEIGTDYVLGRYLDPDESIPLVRIYRLTRGVTGRQ